MRDLPRSTTTVNQPPAPNDTGGGASTGGRAAFSLPQAEPNRPGRPGRLVSHVGAAYLPLLVAALILPLSNGRWSVPAAAWLGPLFLLRYLRARPGARGLPVGWLVFFAAWCVQWRGIVRGSWASFVVAAAVLSLAGFLPYVADRFLSPRLGGLKSTLAFPSALVATEYLFNLLGPNGSWGSLAYTQYGNLPLVQLVSVTGLWGVTFLVGWGAAAANFAWENRHDSARLRRAALTFAAVSAAVLLYGGARLNLSPAVGETLRVAAVSPQHDNNRNYELALGAEIQDFLFERSVREAGAGARMILWPENSFAVLKRDEPATLERARLFARRYGVYLGMAYGVRPEEGSPRYENKMVMLTPSGGVAWEYLKTNAVPGYEERHMVRGGGVVPTALTPDGRFAAVICYDGDYPALVRQAGDAGTDVLILPADDWREVAPLHARMAVFRALEQGTSLVRPTMNGLSLAADDRGRVLASMDHFTAADRVMVAQVPARGSRTLYARVGDAFAWAAILVLLALVARAVVARTTVTFSADARREDDAVVDFGER
jgi:apolipoprotein N-acyltransferase